MFEWINWESIHVLLIAHIFVIFSDTLSLCSDYIGISCTVAQQARSFKKTCYFVCPCRNHTCLLRSSSLRKIQGVIFFYPWLTRYIYSVCIFVCGKFPLFPPYMGFHIWSVCCWCWLRRPDLGRLWTFVERQSPPVYYWYVAVGRVV